VPWGKPGVSGGRRSPPSYRRSPAQVWPPGTLAASAKLATAPNSACGRVTSAWLRYCSSTASSWNRVASRPYFAILALWNRRSPSRSPEGRDDTCFTSVIRRPCLWRVLLRHRPWPPWSLRRGRPDP